MSVESRSPRGLILIIIDTLRTDFCALAGADLPNFHRLRSLCSVFPRARCGSFPTGPMRTDLLTGRLSFLDARWAVPEHDEITLPRALRDHGVWTTAVTDNYVASVPRIGGMLLPDFDVFDFIRGAGSDPWQTPSATLRALRDNVGPNRPPSRSIDFEIQYLANVAAWAEAGGTPTKRVFLSATRQLRALEEHERFLLWIDAFGCHEPWDVPAPGAAELPRLPLFPAYLENEHFEWADIEEWRRQYVRSIRELDRELGRLIVELERVMASGEVALAVLSDHGFLFGEYGFVGKPANTPLPPELHDLVCWLSAHFEPLLPPNERTIQPHTAHRIIRQMFGLDTMPAHEAELHVFGRNSPRSDYIAAATDDDLYIGNKRADGTSAFKSIAAGELRADMPLMKHAGRELPDTIAVQIRRIVDRGRSEWVAPFKTPT